MTRIRGIRQLGESYSAEVANLNRVLADDAKVAQVAAAKGHLWFGQRGFALRLLEFAHREKSLNSKGK